MREFILTALKAKFPRVNANILGRVADMLAKTATTEEEAMTAVAGVTKDYIDVIEAYGDSHATATSLENNSQHPLTKAQIKSPDFASGLFLECFSSLSLV